MSHCNIYKNTISILEEKGVVPDVVIIELACKLYCEAKPKDANYRYLKELRIIPQKISAILNIIDCPNDVNYPAMSTYTVYIEAARQAKERGTI